MRLPAIHVSPFPQVHPLSTSERTHVALGGLFRPRSLGSWWCRFQVARCDPQAYAPGERSSIVEAVGPFAGCCPTHTHETTRLGAVADDGHHDVHTGLLHAQLGSDPDRKTSPGDWRPARVTAREGALC